MAVDGDVVVKGVLGTYLEAFSLDTSADSGILAWLGGAGETFLVAAIERRAAVVRI